MSAYFGEGNAKSIAVCERCGREFVTLPSGEQRDPYPREFTKERNRCDGQLRLLESGSTEEIG